MIFVGAGKEDEEAVIYKIMISSAPQKSSMDKKMESFHSKQHVILSGASRGLGLGLARRLLERGYAVSSFSRKKTAEVSDLEHHFADSFLYLNADSAVPEQLSETVSKAHAKFGPLYGIINNSG